jgi:hypothetical protein
MESPLRFGFASYEDESQKVHSAAGRLRHLLSKLFPIALGCAAFLGFAFFACGFIVGFTSGHSGGYVIGCITSIASLAVYVTVRDVWNTTLAIVSLLELGESSPKEDIKKCLVEYHLSGRHVKSKYAVQVRPDGDYGMLLRITYGKMVILLFRKFSIALILGPSLSMLAAVVLSVVYFTFLSDNGDLPLALLLISVVAAVAWLSAALFGTFALIWFVRPVIRENLRAKVPERVGSADLEQGKVQKSVIGTRPTLLDLHVNSLRRKVGATPERQEAARKAIREAIGSKERGVLGTAIEGGWFAGLPVIELEDAMLDKLKAAVMCKSIEILNEAIEDCRAAGLPEDKLADAMKEKERIERLLAQVDKAIAAKDIEEIDAAIEACQKGGLPLEGLQDAFSTKSSVEKLLAQLKTSISQTQKRQTKRD